MDVHAPIVLIVVIGVISIYRQHRKHAYQRNALPEHVFDGCIGTVPIIRRQCQHASGQRIHDIVAGRLHNHIPCEIGGKSPIVCKDLPKRLQLFRIGQLSEQKQVSHLLESDALPMESLHQLNTVVSPIPKFAVAGRFHAVHHLKCLNFGHIGKPRHNAVAVLVSQSPLYLILVEHLRFQPVGISAQYRIVVQ